MDSSVWPTPTKSTPNLATRPLSLVLQATWPSGLGNGLQIRVHGFDSHRRLNRSSPVRIRGGARFVLLLIGQDFVQGLLGPSVRDETDQRGSPAVTASSEWTQLAYSTNQGSGLAAVSPISSHSLATQKKWPTTAGRALLASPARSVRPQHQAGRCSDLSKQRSLISVRMAGGTELNRRRRVRLGPPARDRNREHRRRPAVEARY